MPGAMVVPAPVAYTKVAVKFVVGSWEWVGGLLRGEPPLVHAPCVGAPSML